MRLCCNGRDRGPKWSSLADGRTDGSGDPEKSSREDTSARSTVNVSDSAGNLDCVGLCDVLGHAWIQTPGISEEVLPSDGVQIYRVAQNHPHFMSRV